MELDHLFIIAQVTDTGSDNADLPSLSAELADRFARDLVEAGFSEGSSNRHPGQGTANRRFFFDGFMLEILYVDDLVGLAEPCASQLGMVKRFTDRHGSPIGVASRRSSIDSCDANYPFNVYQPHYLPPELHIQIAQFPADNEPLWFHLPFVSGSEDVDTQPDKEPRLHSNKSSRLSAVVIEMPFKPSAASCDIADQLHIELKQSDRHAVHLVFDGGCQGIHLLGTSSIPLTISI